MDDDYTYDEMCPEEAEFLYYEGGESYADDDCYVDDYVHHHYAGQPNHGGDNTDFVHHAALYGGYLASRECNRKRDMEWERSMEKYRKKWQDICSNERRSVPRRQPINDTSEWDKAMAEYRRKKAAGLLDTPTPVKSSKVSAGKSTPNSDDDSIVNYLMFSVVVAISFVASLIICYIVYPIAHIFFLCDDFFCTHDLSPEFIVCLLVTVGIVVVLWLLVIVADKHPAPTNNYTRNQRTRRHYSGGGLGTDYYDSGMEGAPGYYGGD